MKFKEIGIIVLGLVLLYGLARFSGVVQFYENGTPAMEPTLKTGSMIFASNIKSPKRYSIVAFDINPFLENNQFDMPSEESTHISRVVALENEEIKIKDGVIYINDLKIKPPYEFQFTYKMKSIDYERYKDEYNLELMNHLQPGNQYADVYMSHEKAEEIKEIVEIEKWDMPINGGNLYRISDIVKPGWTTNNFGPIKVPKGHYFMVSDNRNNSLDSRSYGCISAEKIVGVKI